MELRPQPQVIVGTDRVGDSWATVVTSVASPPVDPASHLAWRSYIQSHRSILREIDAELTAAHGVTTRDYEVLLYLVQAADHQLPMSALAECTMLTRSGVTRLIDGLVSAGLIERVCCPSDGRVSYARLTDAGCQKLRDARRTYAAHIHQLFIEHFNRNEIEQLASLLGRLPGGEQGGSRVIA